MRLPGNGDRVLIEGIGEGTIIKIVGESALVQISSARGLTIEIPLNKVKFLAEKTRDLVAKSNNLREREIRSALDDKSRVIRRTVESLRFGLVPEYNIEELTLGFEELSDWVIGSLTKCAYGIPSGFEVSGPYGTGKSHTLSLIRYLAKRNGFLTAKVEVDGQNVSLSNPSFFLNSIWSSLSESGLDPDHPLLDIYIKAMNNKGIPTTVVNEGNNRIRNILNTIDLLRRTNNFEKFSHVIDSLISSSEEYSAAEAIKIISEESRISKILIKLENIISKSVDERPKNLVEALAAHATLARWAGYKGLIITVDEFEIERNDNKNLIKVNNTLSVLQQYLNGRTQIFKAPLGLFFAAVDQSGCQGDPILESTIVTERTNCFRLKPWESPHRVRLAENIHDIYCKAYSLNKAFEKNIAVNMDGILAERINNNESELIRSFIKWYVGMLDIKYGPPEVGADGA